MLAAKRGGAAFVRCRGVVGGAGEGLVAVGDEVAVGGADGGQGGGWLVVESPGEDLGGPFHADTGQLLRELTIDPTRDYQPLGRPPGPRPKTP